MKKLNKWFLLALVLAPILWMAPGCKTPTLQPGGAYAPTNSAGVQVIAPDIGFYQVEAGFKFAHEAVMTAFDLEYSNRALLWKIAPDIKKTLDGIRPDFNYAVLQYATARDTYRANPTPANLTGMDFWLSKMKQLAVTAQAVTTSISTK